MTNILNNSNNYSLLDNNLLSYGLLLGSLTILGFSLYYFSGNIFRSCTNNLDKDVQNTSNNLDANTQTLPNHADNYAQTSDAHLAEKLQELLYGMCSEGDNLSDIDPVTFANEIRNNPEYSGWFNSIQDWANDIKTSSGKSFNSSELDFLKRIKEELNSVTNSPIIDANSPVTDISPLSLISDKNSLLNSNYEILFNKLSSYGIDHKITTIEQLKSTLDMLSITLTENNIDNIAYILSVGTCA